MSQTAAVPPMLNKTMKFILRSPLHRFSSSYLLLITFKGRKSGTTYTTPVSYSREDDTVTIFTHANWWKNLRGGALVTLRIRGQEVRGIAEPIAEDKTAIAAALTAHLKKSAFDAKFYQVAFDEAGEPIQSDVEEAVKTVVMVRVQINSPDDTNARLN
ncbi:MAG: nitroreductase family deazaflavin-dependent oxidoreductase [Anaerolineaceae bacterium]|nr:nitroreductase family deazaflavin-dependent oxidoreductase [Anaerolineaceae bacterium]